MASWDVIGNVSEPLFASAAAQTSDRLSERQHRLDHLASAVTKLAQSVQACAADKSDVLQQRVTEVLHQFSLFDVPPVSFTSQLSQLLRTVTESLVWPIPYSVISDWQECCLSMHEAESSLKTLVTAFQHNNPALLHLPLPLVQRFWLSIHNNASWLSSLKSSGILEATFFLGFLFRTVQGIDSQVQDSSRPTDMHSAPNDVILCNVREAMLSMKQQLAAKSFLASHQRASLVSWLLVLLRRHTRPLNTEFLSVFTIVDHLIFNSQHPGCPGALPIQAFVENEGCDLLHRVANTPSVPMRYIAVCFRLTISLLLYLAEAADHGLREEQHIAILYSKLVGPLLRDISVVGCEKTAGKQADCHNILDTDTISSGNVDVSGLGHLLPQEKVQLLTNQFVWYFDAATDCSHFYRSLMSPHERPRTFDLLARWPAVPSDLLNRILFSLKQGNESSTESATPLTKLDRSQFFSVEPYERVSVVIELIAFCIRRVKDPNLWKAYLGLMTDARSIFTRLDSVDPGNACLLTRMVNTLGSLLISPPTVLLNSPEMFNLIFRGLELLDHVVLGSMTIWQTLYPDKLWDCGKTSWWIRPLRAFYHQFLDSLGFFDHFLPKQALAHTNTTEQRPTIFLLDHACKFHTTADTCKLRSHRWQSLLLTLSAQSALLCPELALVPLYVLRARSDLVLSACTAPPKCPPSSVLHHPVNTLPASATDHSTRTLLPWEISFTDFTSQLNAFRAPLVAFHIMLSAAATSSCPLLSEPLKLFSLVHVLVSFEAVKCIVKRSSNDFLWEAREHIWACVSSFLVGVDGLLGSQATVAYFLRLRGFELLISVASYTYYGRMKGRAAVLKALLTPHLADCEQRIRRIVQVCVEMGVATGALSSTKPQLGLKPKALAQLLSHTTPVLRQQLLHTIATSLLSAGQWSILLAVDTWTRVLSDLAENASSSLLSPYVIEETLHVMVELLDCEQKARCRMIRTSQRSMEFTLAEQLRENSALATFLPCCRSPRCSADAEVMAVCSTCSSRKTSVAQLRFWQREPHLVSLALRFRAYVHTDDSILLLRLMVSVQPTTPANDVLAKNPFFGTSLCDGETVLPRHPDTTPFSGPESSVLTVKFSSLHDLPRHCLLLIIQFIEASQI